MENSVLTGMSVLTEDAKVFENVIQIMKGLVVTLFVCSLFLLGEIWSAAELIIFSLSGFICQCLISWKKRNTNFSGCIKLTLINALKKYGDINIAFMTDGEKVFCLYPNNTKRKTHLQQFPWISLQHLGFCSYLDDISLQVCGKPSLSVVHLHLWTLPARCSSFSWQLSPLLPGGCTLQAWQETVT